MVMMTVMIATNSKNLPVLQKPKPLKKIAKKVVSSGTTTKIRHYINDSLSDNESYCNDDDVNDSDEDSNKDGNDDDDGGGIDDDVGDIISI
jgi:hypothetical protein